MTPAKPSALEVKESELLARYREHFNPEIGMVDFRPTASSSMSTLEFILLLCRSGKKADIAMASQAVEGFFRPQILCPDDENFGWIPLQIEATYRDKNAPLFHIPGLVEAASFKSLPKGTRTMLDEGLRRLFTAAERRWDEEIFDPHRDFKAYTNVFLMHIQALLLGARYLALPRRERRAEAEWQRWFNHVAYLGLDEFASTTYHEVDHETLTRMLGLFQNPRILSQIRMVLAHLEAVQKSIEHPRLGLPICGSSRDYRRFLLPASGRFKPFLGKAPESRRTFPYEAEGRATATPFRFKSWQDFHCGLGTMTGGHYFWQNLHGLAAVGDSASRRELAFLPGTFSTIPGYCDHQGPRALFVFGRVPVSLYRTQIPTPDDEIPSRSEVLGVGVTPGWSVLSDQPGRLHLAAYGHELFLDAFAVESGLCVPVQLKRVRHQAGTARRLGCRFDGDIDEYEFASNASWFGVVAELRRATANVPAVARVERELDDRCQTFRAGDLAVRLFDLPTGEQVQIHRDDWRATPLFLSPDHVLWPGQWLQKSVNA